MNYRVDHGDCIEAMREMDEASVDAIVTDPPYGLEFMGKAWDRLGDRGQAKHGGMKPGGIAAAGVVNFNASGNIRCRKCNHWKWGHKPGDGGGGGLACQCDSPEFPSLRALQAPLMQEWHQRWATEALRVLKPGGHLLAFGGTRTYHRLACAVEDAGFEIRDSLIWLYGSGFPKSLDVSKAIDKAAGAEREAMGTEDRRGAFDGVDRDSEGHSNEYGSITNKGVVERTAARHRPSCNVIEVWPINDDSGEWEAVDTNGEGNTLLIGTRDDCEAEAEHRTTCAPDCAVRWQGWGTALKPSHEPVVVARKPLIGTVAANVLEHGTGALNVDGCRIGTDEPILSHGGSGNVSTYSDWDRQYEKGNGREYRQGGRWPANVALSPEAAAELDRQSGSRGNHGGAGEYASRSGFGGGVVTEAPDDTGGASRFFYCAKASRAERNAGLDGFAEQKPHDNAGHVHADERAWDIPGSHSTARANQHPTVKPIDLMRWLCRLVTPPGGTVLDPFAGSGTTGCAAMLEGFDFIGIEREAEYVEIARARIAHAYRQPVAIGLWEAAA